MITADNLPIIVTALTTFCTSFFWPLIVLIILVFFNKDLRVLLRRLESAKGPGGTEAAFTPYGKGPIEKSSTEKNIDKIYQPSPTIDWKKTGNLFWLPSDILWTIDILLRGGPRELIVRGVNQALHHARAVGFKDSTIETRLMKLLKIAQDSVENEWTENQRFQFANDLWNIHSEIGTLAANNQPDYKPKE